MTVDYQSSEIRISASEWVTVILPDSTEVTVEGSGRVWTDGGKELQ